MATSMTMATSTTMATSKAMATSMSGDGETPKEKSKLTETELISHATDEALADLATPNISPMDIACVDVEVRTHGLICP